MNTFKIYGADQKWIFAHGFFLFQEKYTKTEASKILKIEPIRKIVNVYDYGPFGCFDMVCSVVVWAGEKKCVLAAGIKPEEKILLLNGCINTAYSADRSLKTEILLRKLLSTYATDWQEQMRIAFGGNIYRAKVFNRNEHVYARCGTKTVEIMPH